MIAKAFQNLSTNRNFAAPHGEDAYSERSDQKVFEGAKKKAGIKKSKLSQPSPFLCHTFT